MTLFFAYEASYVARKVEFEKRFNAFGEILVPLKLLCIDMEINYTEQRKAQTGELLKLEKDGVPYGQPQVHITLDAVMLMVANLLSAQSYKKLKGLSTLIIPKYKDSFYTQITSQLNPTPISETQEIYLPMAMQGESALRRNLVQMGECAANVSNIVSNSKLNNNVAADTVGNFEVVETRTKTLIPGLSRELRPGESLTTSKLTVMTLNMDNYKDGDFARRGIVTRAKFERDNPEHELNHRKLDLLSLYEVGYVKGKQTIIKNTILKPIQKPWDNQPRLCAVF